MTNQHSIIKTIRILSLAILPVAPLACLIWHGCPDVGSLCIALYESAVVLILSPVGSEWKEFCESEAFLAAFLFVAVAALDLGPVAVALAASAVMAGSIIHKTIRKYSLIRTLFIQNAPYNELYDYSKLVWMVAAEFFALLLVVLYPCRPALFAYAVVLAFFAFLMYWKSYTGKSLMMNAPRERMLRELVKGGMKESTRRVSDDDARMSALYSKLQAVMQEKRPYLDPRLDLGALSEIMLTNRMYLSKTINIMSGRNFCSFVNYYRVHYATDLMRRDPLLKMNEVGIMSGFASPVSFSMSFKAILGKSPSVYARELKSKAKKRFK